MKKPWQHTPNIGHDFVRVGAHQAAGVHRHSEAPLGVVEPWRFATFRRRPLFHDNTAKSSNVGLISHNVDGILFLCLS